MAGPFGLAPLLQEAPSWLRAAAGFYTVWDLAPFRDLEVPPSEDDIREWSCTTALDRDGPLPPVFIARAGKDGARLNAGTDAFVARALARNLEVTVHNHETGQHGFDIRDDDPRSRQIIEAALDFFTFNLRRARDDRNSSVMVE